MTDFSSSSSPSPKAAYIHIPFCHRRCYYCDFPISVLGDKTDINISPSIQEYVEVLCQEILLTPILEHSLGTVFFGGGTPSLIPAKSLGLILNTLDRHFSINNNAEISMEIDPGTFTLEQLKGYQKIGVNRFSLGVQSFQEELLKICGRSHSLDDIFMSIDLLHQVGIDNFSLDLISGLPHQTIEQWHNSLEIAIKIKPRHISCYDMVLEPVTAFGKKYQPGKKPLPTDETTAQMYRIAQQMLTQSGYQHYEISNYAQPGYQCRHNRVYWENKAYYGFGMGAASYTQRQRFTRPRSRKEYYPWVQQLKENGGIIDCPQNSEIDILLETLMLGLRLTSGINIAQIQNLFGEKVFREILSTLKPYQSLDWIEFLDKTGSFYDKIDEDNFSKIEVIRLTDPEGLLFSNTILTSLFEAF